MSEKIDKYLSSVGLKFPETKEELIVFENAHRDHEYKLKGDLITPERILLTIQPKHVITKRLVGGSDKKSSLTKGQTFFRRTVLAAKITHECYNERTFGSVKFQKLVYLCEQVSKMNFSTNYSKQVAGPFDNKFMHSIGREFQKQNWFSVQKVQEGNFSKVKFSPLQGVDGYIKYYQSYFGAVDSEIEYLINTFRCSYTNEVELVATIFAVWDEINSQKAEFAETLIVERVYAWNESKKKFSELEIIKNIGWMRERGIYPASSNI